MFEGFALTTIRGIRLRLGGNGPPVLLLHGHPQTHAMWHAVAAILARDFTKLPRSRARSSPSDLPR